MSGNKCKEDCDVSDYGLSGHTYEINLSAYVFLELYNRANRVNRRRGESGLIVEDFYIASNMEGVKCLDDIVVKVVYRNSQGIQEQRTSFIQMKHRGNINVTLEKFFSGDLKKYFDAFQKTKKNFIDRAHDPEFATHITNAEIILFTIASLGGACKSRFIECDITQDHLRLFNDVKQCYMLNADVMCKRDNKDEINIMTLLNDDEECAMFVKNIVDALCSDVKNDKAKDLLHSYRECLLEDVITVTAPGIGVIKPELYTSDKIKSPFQEYFIKEIKEKTSLTIDKIQVPLPIDFNSTRTGSVSNVLPYSRKYFEEFLNIFKIYLKQPDENKVKELIETSIKNNYPLQELEAKDVSILLIAKVRDWWQDSSTMVDNLDKNTTFIKDSMNTPIKFNVNIPTNWFTGRSNELEIFHSFVMKSGLKKFVVCGLGGVGKTEFMRTYIQSYSEFYDQKLIWIDSQDDNKLIGSFVNFVEQKLTFIETTKEEFIKEVFEYFQDKKCLFIFDNAENTESFRKVLELTDPSDKWMPHFIITSRMKTGWPNYVQPFELNVLHEREATEFIKKFALANLEIDNDNSEEMIKELVGMLDGLPLTLQQVTSYITSQRMISNYTIKDFIDDFKKEPEIFLDSEISNQFYEDYTLTTLKTWTMTVNKIESHPLYGNTARVIFRIISLCSPDNIPVEMFYKINGSTKTEVTEGINLLVMYSMVSEDNNKTMLRVHRLVQQVTRINFERLETECVNVLKNAFMLFKDNIKRDTIDHVIAIWKFATKCGDIKKFTADYGYMFKDIITVLFKESRFKESETMYDFAKQLLESFPVSHKYVIDIKVEFVKVLIRLSKLDEAKSLCERVLSESNKDNLESRYEANSQIGVIFKDKSEYDKAIDIFHNMLDDVIRDLGAYHAVTIRVKEGIASIHKLKGFYNQALDIFQDILRALKAQDNVDLTMLLQARANVASCLKYLGNYKEAEEIFDDILSIQKQQYGENNAMTVRTMNNISVLYFKQGKCREGLDILHKAYNMKMKFYGKICPSVLTTKHNIASNYLRLPSDLWEEGLQLLEEVAMEREQLLGLNHKSTLNTLEKKAKMLHLLKRYEEALTLLQDTYDRAVKLYKNKEHPRVLELYLYMGKSFAGLEKKQQASKIMQEVLNVYRKKEGFGEDHPVTLTVMYEIGKLYESMGRVDEALDMLHTVRYKSSLSTTTDDVNFQDITGIIKQLNIIKMKSLSLESYLQRYAKHMVIVILLFAFIHFCFKFLRHCDLRAMDFFYQWTFFDDD